MSSRWGLRGRWSCVGCDLCPSSEFAVGVLLLQAGDSAAACGVAPKSGVSLDDDEEDFVPAVDPATGEWGGPTKGGTVPEPTRFGDWERGARCIDF